MPGCGEPVVVVVVAVVAVVTGNYRVGCRFHTDGGGSYRDVDADEASLLANVLRSDLRALARPVWLQLRCIDVGLRLRL